MILRKWEYHFESGTITSNPTDVKMIQELWQAYIHNVNNLRENEHIPQRGEKGRAVINLSNLCERVVGPSSCVCVCVCVCLCVYVCVCVSGSPPQESILKAPCWCLSSDTVYWKVEADSKGVGFSPAKLHSTSDAGHNPRLLPVLLTNQL